MIRNNIFLQIILLTLNALTVLAQDKISLRMTDWAAANEIEIDKKTIELFHSRYPNIEVIYEPNPGHQYEEKILTSLAVDEPPDVFLLDSKLIPTFTNKNILLDLNPFLRELNIDTSQWFTNATNIARRGSSLYAFPKGFSTLAVFFNKRLFRDAGLEYPSPGWTWDDYLRIAKSLTRDADGDGRIDVYGAFFSNQYYSWIPWVWSAGGDVVDPTGRYSTGYLNSEPTRDALQFLADLRMIHQVSPGVGTWVQEEKTGAGSSLFVNGRIGMIIDGHWRIPTYLKQMRESKLEVGIAPFPFFKPMGKKNVLYESGWCVPVNSKHRREAVMLAAFMAGEEAGRVRGGAYLEIPANIKAAEESARNDLAGFSKIFLDEMQYARQPWGSVIERFSEIEWTLQDAMDELLINKKSFLETFPVYERKIDAQLRQIRSSQGQGFKPIKENSEVIYFLIAVSAAVLAVSSLFYFLSGKKEKKIRGRAMAFLAPSAVHLTVFLLTPIIFSFYLSVHQWDIVVQEKPFVALDNYVELFKDASFWNALKNTVLFSLNVPVGMALSLFVAVMLNRKMKFVGFLRTVYFLPSVTSFVAIALVWMWIYHPTFGLANYFLNMLGIPSSPWLNSTETAMISVMIFSVWLNVGYQMVIFLAGLQGIPDELYEAARVDGANHFTQFLRITFPLLAPTTYFILITSLIGSFQVFTTVYMMTGGGPVGSTDVIVYHVYHSAWEQLRMGYASAISWVLFVIIMLITYLQFRLFKKEIEYN